MKPNNENIQKETRNTKGAFESWRKFAMQEGAILFFSGDDFPGKNVRR